MRATPKHLLIRRLIFGGVICIVLLSIFPLNGCSSNSPEMESPPRTQPASDHPTQPLPATMTFPSMSALPATSTSIPPTLLPNSFLADQIAAILPDYGGDWNILIRADGERDMVDIHADQGNHIASIIKLPIAMLFFKVIEKRGVQPSEYDEYLSTRGDGRTYMQLLTAMLVESEEDATDTIKETIYDSKIDVNSLLESWGAAHTDLGLRRSTPRDIASIYETLYFGDAITPKGRAIILSLLSSYTANDKIRFGVLRPSLPDGAEYYNKRGTITKDRLVVGDSALIAWETNGTRHVYVLVALAYGSEDRPTTNVKLDRGIEAIAHLFWDFVTSP